MSEKWKIGEKIEGRYEILYIKRGGMGIVFLCYDHEFKSPVAIKTFQDKYLTDKDSIDRFMWEAETWVRLEKHKNIVRANYVKNISGRPYVFLELVLGDNTYGPDLTGWIRYKGLDLNTTLSFAIQFCRGMEHAEKKFREMGKIFLHRDIKPGNIMVTQDKVVKITDFGLVKTFTGSKGDIDIGSVKDEVTGVERFGFSKAGSICGTPHYMSPEQCRGDDEIDIRSDIYAFGCVLYEMLTGQPPFICPTFDDYRMHHLTIEPRLPKELSPDIPKQLNTLVMKCLEKEPSKRYQDFKSLRDELSEIYFQQSGKRIKEETPQELEEWELNNKGVALKNLGKPQEAIACYDRALEINPGYAKVWNNKGAALNDLGKLQEAIDCYDRALEINPMDASIWYNKGTALNKLGEYQEAIDCFDKALEINPVDASIWYKKGAALDNLSKPQDEMAYFDRALEINPSDAGAWNNKGAYLEKLGKHQEAIDAYKNFIKFAPLERAELVANVKNLIKQLEAQLESKAKTEKNYKDKLEDAEAWYNKGIILDDLDRLQEAIDCYDRALEINPRLAKAWNNKGIALYDLGKHQETLSCYDMALEINPRYAEAWYNKGVTLYDLGKHQETLSCYDMALEINPRYAEAWYNKGVTLGSLGKLQEALDAFQNLIKIAPPEDAKHLANVKEIIKQLEAQLRQNYEEKEKKCREAIRIVPNITEELTEAFKEALEKLTSREREILKYRMGLEGEYPHTFEEVGTIFGLTSERIRDIVFLAELKLKKYLTESEDLE